MSIYLSIHIKLLTDFGAFDFNATPQDCKDLPGIWKTLIQMSSQTAKTEGSQRRLPLSFPGHMGKAAHRCVWNMAGGTLTQGLDTEDPQWGVI